MACCSGHTDQRKFDGEGFFPRCPECGRYHRDTTPAFQGLVMEACAAVIPTSRRMHRKFKIDGPETTWTALADEGLICIDTPGQGKSYANYHSVGSWDEGSGAFKWSWALEEDERPSTIKAVDHARRVGSHYWLRSLTAPTLYVGENEAWHLAMITAYLSDHPGVTAMSTNHGKSLIVLEKPVRAN